MREKMDESHLGVVAHCKIIEHVLDSNCDYLTLVGDRIDYEEE